MCNALCVRSPDRQLERSHVLVVQLIHLCSPLHQDLDNLLPPTTHRVMQGGGVSGTRGITAVSWLSQPVLRLASSEAG